MKFSKKNMFFILYLIVGISDINAQVPENISIHGFGGWAAGFSDNNNVFVFATEDGEYNNYHFALNLAAQPSDKLSIFTQLCWSRDIYEKEVHLDYMFAQYMLSSSLKFRIGNLLSPFGLYSEIYDVGTLRPFYLLPVGMYNGPGLFPQSYVGLGITGEFLISKNWEINYDFVAGEMELPEFKLEIPTGFDPITGLPIIEKSNVLVIGREMAGAKVSFIAPLIGLKFGLSYMNFDLYSIKNNEPRQQSDEYKNNRQNMISGHLEYITDKVTIRSEMYQVTDVSKAEGGYIEAAYQFYKNWQIAANYDWFENKTESLAEKTIIKSLLNHKSIGLGLNYWFNPNFVFKAGFYKIDDHGFAQPELLYETFFTGDLKKKTTVVIIGTQFSF